MMVYRGIPSNSTATSELFAKSMLSHNQYVYFRVVHAAFVREHQWQYWAGDSDPEAGTEAAENERTNGHSLSFRCLALDLYYFWPLYDAAPSVEGDDVLVVSDDVYGPLAHLCDLYYSG